MKETPPDGYTVYMVSLDEEQDPLKKALLTQPTPLQDAIRRWILLLPLLTSLAGSGLVHWLGQDDYIDLLPPILFSNALLITVAMIHQRRMSAITVDLADRMQRAYHHLSLLHRITRRISSQPELEEIGQEVVNSVVEGVPGSRVALWVRAVLTGEQRSGAAPESQDLLQQLGEDQAMNWGCLASSGWAALDPLLLRWQKELGHTLPLEVPTTLSPGSLPPGLPPDLIASREHVMVLPLIWQEQRLGALVVAREGKEFQKEESSLLNDLALATNQALQNAILFRTVLQKADIDGLTGVYNRRAVNERLAQEVARVHRARFKGQETNLAVAMMDLTDFKIFNDTYGHALGDEVLRLVSHTLKSSFRVSDSIGRYGGDEFLALLPDTDHHGAEVLGARMVEKLASRPLIAPDGSSVIIRLNCGVASIPQDAEGADDLISVADQRLYEAKRAGRQLVTEQAASQKDDFQPPWQVLGLLESMINTIDLRDHYTRAHSQRVAVLCHHLAGKLNLRPEETEALALCSLVFDIGKIALPDSILRKPGVLSREERKLMEQHTIIGAQLVNHLPHEELVRQGVRHHHENYDGSGYPDGLKGDDIPLIARLIAVTECYSAMVTDRPYRKSLGQEAALKELKAGAGHCFDPHLAKLLLALLADEVSAV